MCLRVDTIGEFIICVVVAVIGFAVMIAIHLFIEERKEDKK